MILNYIIMLIVAVNADYNILGNFSECHQNDEIVELDQLLYDNQLYNSLTALRLHEDEFQSINIKGESLIVYCNNGLLFSTSCSLINEFFIPRFFNECTIDLPVYYIHQNKKNIRFFTKTGILRNTSMIVDCKEEPSVFNLGKKFITMLNKTARVKEKKLLNIFDLSNRFLKHFDNATNQKYSFFDYYFQNFAENKVFITIRDISEYIFMVVVTFLFKNKYALNSIFQEKN